MILVASHQICDQYWMITDHGVYLLSFLISLYLETLYIKDEK